MCQEGSNEVDNAFELKKIMMETAQHICGMSKGPCRYKETWWWNEEVAEAVREKKIKYKQEGQHPLTRQHAANFKLLANQSAERRLVTQ